MDQGVLFPSSEARHLTRSELEAGLDYIRNSPKDDGVIEMIVCRPGEGRRRVLDEGRFDPAVGLMGDNWKIRFSRDSPDGLPDPDTQLNIMNSRVVALIAAERGRWPLAGDQLYVDFDLSNGNLPPGSRIGIGDAIIEITPPPHTGCKKFVARFGIEAMKFVNSPTGKKLNLRGVNARVIKPGTIRVGDRIRKIT